MRVRRATGLTHDAAGAYWCGGCQGTGTATYRDWGRGGPRIVRGGTCPMCRGGGARFQNHAPKGRGLLPGMGKKK